MNKKHRNLKQSKKDKVYKEAYGAAYANVDLTVAKEFYDKKEIEDLVNKVYELNIKIIDIINSSYKTALHEIHSLKDYKTMSALYNKINDKSQINSPAVLFAMDKNCDAMVNSLESTNNSIDNFLKHDDNNE